MKTSSVGALAALVVAVALLWLAWQGYQVVTWRMRYMMPAFLSGALVGGAVVAFLSHRD